MGEESASVQCEGEPSPFMSFRKGLCVLLGSLLLMALSYECFFSKTASDSSATSSSYNGEALAMKASSGGLMEMCKLTVAAAEPCDLFAGEWIEDPHAPAYNNTKCSFVSSYDDCLGNGRSETSYLYWRWKPYGCHLHPPDAERFLRLIRGKSIAFIGDSVAENQMESFLCLLSKVEEAVLIYYDSKFQSRTWSLPSYDVTLAFIWTPFLLSSTEAASVVDMQLYLDTLDDTWTSQYHKYDYILLSGGQWFFKQTIFWDNNTVVGCHYCPGKNLEELGSDYSYRRALQLAFQFMATSEHRPVVVFRTWAPNHYEYLQVYKEGMCNRTRPYEEGEHSEYQAFDLPMRSVEMEEVQRAAEEHGMRVRLLDTYQLSAMRPDGHPGPYRIHYPELIEDPENDCIHWCLPGVIDTWNVLLMEVLRKEEKKRAEL